MRALGMVTALVVLAASAAQATPITYSFSGVVNESVGGVLAPGQILPVGSAFSLAVTLDSGLQSAAAGPGVTSYFSGVAGVATILSATLNGASINSSVQTVTVSRSASNTELNVRATDAAGKGFELDVTSYDPALVGASGVPGAFDPAYLIGGSFRRSVSGQMAYFGGMLDMAVPTSVVAPATPAVQVIDAPAAAWVFMMGVAGLAVRRVRRA